ncbi:hypothetical protein Sjap_000137 [Stephania japonica]|uniref:ELMO domain-containing protein n=1 Tax=Stephania japonica TaxID=461633 RepID=A0AAP0KJU3_9MAGN
MVGLLFALLSSQILYPNLLSLSLSLSLSGPALSPPTLASQILYPNLSLSLSLSLSGPALSPPTLAFPAKSHHHREHPQIARIEFEFNTIRLQVDEDCGYWRQKGRHEDLAWAHNLAHVISQSAQCFTNAMVGPRSWLGGLFYRSSNKRSDKNLDHNLTPIQQKRLRRLQERLVIPFDETRPDHQEALRELWKAAYPDVHLTGLISDQWKDMGWQGPNPSTDFRGCGFVSLENLLFFARTYPSSFHRLLLSETGNVPPGNTPSQLLALMCHLC